MQELKYVVVAVCGNCGVWELQCIGVAACGSGSVCGSCRVWLLRGMGFTV